MNNALVSIASIATFGAVALWLFWLAFSRVHSAFAQWLIAVTLLVLAAAGIWLIDTNIPLESSHYRPDGGPVPGWLALLSLTVRWVSLAALAMAFQRSRA